MSNRLLIITFILSISFFQSRAQSYPWERPLKFAWSSDGITFGAPTIFQDSSGVPSVIKWKGDTLICAFQWFRVPVGSTSWDRVAVKFSYDNGLNWTSPTPIIVNGIPANFQRPFDPALVTFDNDSIRIFFSSSDGMPTNLDSTVNTYSAKSADGINYEFEPDARVDESSNRVIDPSVIYFNNSWHYAAPAGSPQQGAYHYVSPDGLNFSSVPLITSDNMHNWTGNCMVDSVDQLRFYGSSPTFIWYNSSANGGIWNGYINTNVQGGDPSVVKVSTNNYLMVYVGEQYTVDVDELMKDGVILYPNPASDFISLSSLENANEYDYIIYSIDGKIICHESGMGNLINVKNLVTGSYFLVIQPFNYLEKSFVVKFTKY